MAFSLRISTQIFAILRRKNIKPAPTDCRAMTEPPIFAEFPAKSPAYHSQNPPNFTAGYVKNHPTFPTNSQKSTMIYSFSQWQATASQSNFNGVNQKWSNTHPNSDLWKLRKFLPSQLFQRHKSTERWRLAIFPKISASVQTAKYGWKMKFSNG